MNHIVKENKIEKSLRNSAEFAVALERASAGNYDVDISEKPERVGRLPLLKVTEEFTLRKGFCLETGNDYFQLYKEVFYVENPGSNYFETVEPIIYRRVASQHEKGDIDWAKRVAKQFSIKIADFDGNEIKEKKASKKKTAAKKATKKAKKA